MIVRQMLSRDIDEVYRIETESFSMPWSFNSLKEELENKFAYYYVAEIDKKVVAYCGFQEILGEGEITNVAVDKEYRRKGIAKRLFSHLLKQADLKLIDCITLEVRCSNEAAKALYESFGFKAIAIRKDYYQKPKEDAVIMQSSLEDRLKCKKYSQ